MNEKHYLGDAVYYQNDGFGITLTTENGCSISGIVFDSDSNKPLSGVWVDLYRDFSNRRPQPLKRGVATTGPNGEFSINCSSIEESQFPLVLALRHQDWVSTHIKRIIESSGKWDGINIPIAMSEVDLKPLRELRVSFSTETIGSDLFLTGHIENRSDRSFPCVTLRFGTTPRFGTQETSGIGNVDVEVRNLGPREERPYRKKLSRRHLLAFQAGVPLMRSKGRYSWPVVRH